MRREFLRWGTEVLVQVSVPVLAFVPGHLLDGFTEDRASGLSVEPAEKPLFFKSRCACRGGWLRLLADGCREYKLNSMNPGQPNAVLRQAEADTRAGRYLRAIDQFESCLNNHGHEILPVMLARYLSYYGVCVAMVWGRTEQPLRWCTRALKQCAPSADLHHNLALVLLRNGRREQAQAALQAGQRLDPKHSGIKATLQRLTPRRSPAMGFLHRRHPVNRYLGLFRSRFLGA